MNEERTWHWEGSPLVDSSSLRLLGAIGFAFAETHHVCLRRLLNRKYLSSEELSIQVHDLIATQNHLDPNCLVSLSLPLTEKLVCNDQGVNMNWKTDTVSETTKVSEVIKAPDDGWSDDEFILNLPPELLESGQTAVRHKSIECIGVLSVYAATMNSKVYGGGEQCAGHLPDCWTFCTWRMISCSLPVTQLHYLMVNFVADGYEIWNRFRLFRTGIS